MKKCRGFVSENGRLERHQYCPLEPCGVRGLDDKKVNQDSHGNAGKESNSVNST